ncbi:MAG: hypothetical protein ACPG4T_09790 [Nannocystaceae bacterium]
MTKSADAALARTAITDSLVVHPRLVQQGLEPDRRQRNGLAKQLPNLRAFADNHYTSVRAVLDWDHHLPSKMMVLRIYATYSAREAERLDREFERRARQIGNDNIYPEFDLPDYGEIEASETYVSILNPGSHKLQELRFFSEWRKQVKQTLLRDALIVVRGQSSFERSLRNRSHDHLGPPVVIGWAPPCLAHAKNWAIEVWLLVEFNGQSGRAHVFMVDCESRKVTREHYTDVHLG